MAKNKGFSLIEILAASGILIIITISIALLQRNIFSFGRLIQGNLDAQKEAKRAFAQMTKDIRNASYASNGAYPIASASTSSLTFFADVDGDKYKEQVRYFVDASNTLRRGIIEPITSTQPISYSAPEVNSILVSKIFNTSTPIFTYYNTNYNGTSSTAPLSYPLNMMDVRLVKIEILLKTQEGNQQPLTIIMTTHAMLRNLKDNL
ncbi:MAG: hypothetical protein WC449_03990 [Candidatus Paceibacterota bacterium]